MPIYCIDDGGDGSQTNTTQSAGTLDWSKADASVADLISYDAAAFTTSGNIIYFGDDHNDPDKAAHWTLTLPSSGLPAILISADRTNSTPTYKKGTGAQLSSLGGAYNMTADGSVACYGMRFASGAIFLPVHDVNEAGVYADCSVAIGANSTLYIGGNVGNSEFYNLTVDLTADGTTARTGIVFANDTALRAKIIGLAFVNAAYRTASVFAAYPYCLDVSNADFSGFTNGTPCEIAQNVVNGTFNFTNCLTAETWSPIANQPGYGGQVMFTNCGPADAPTYLYFATGRGTVASTASIYRTGGATVEGDACAWLVTTTAGCGESAPFWTPYIYGTVSSTGSKTFTCHITNDTADFTNAEVWLEVEYLKDSDEAQWTLATDQRATITTTPAAQTDDTTSVWVGLNDDSQGLADYMQSLAVTATVGETGQYRARVAVGVASIAASRYFYVDPKITVS
jgi:hypothetical protein